MTDMRRCRVEERRRSPRNDETARIDANAREAVLTAVFRRAKALRPRSPASVCARLVEGNGPTELQSLIDQLDGAWFDYAVASVYTLLLPVERRKRLGAYFTPPHLVSHLMTRLEAAGLDLLLHRVHDPAAGGAAFVVPLVDAVAGQLLRSGWSHGAVLRELCRRFSGVELDKGLAHIANALLRRMLRIRHGINCGDDFTLVSVGDSLKGIGRKVDAVVGNPPYAKVGAKGQRKWAGTFADILCGQLNLYAMFLRRSLDHVPPGGLVGFIVPTSFLGGPEFRRLRVALLEGADVLMLDLIEKRTGLFLDVIQDTCFVVLKRRDRRESVALTNPTACPCCALSSRASFGHWRKGRRSWGLRSPYLSDRGIAPADVSDDVIGRFARELNDTSLRGRPTSIARGAIRGWNVAVYGVPSWPQQRLTLPDRHREGYVLAAQSFSPAFQSSLADYIAFLTDPPEEDDAPFRGLRPNTLALREFQFRQMASALVHQGVPIEDITSIGVLAQRESVDMICDFFLARNEGTISEQLGGMLTVLRPIATYQLKDRELTEWIRRRLRRLSGGRIRRFGVTEKNRRRIVLFRDAKHVRDLLVFPYKLLKRAEGASLPAKKAAALVRTAVAIELEIMCPVRLQNLSEINVDTDLVRSRSGKGASVNLFIPGKRTKNGEDIELELPKQSVGLIDLYLAKYRNELILPEHRGTSPRYLFPRPDGTAMPGKNLAFAICSALWRDLGIKFNVHLFRHAATKRVPLAGTRATAMLRHLVLRLEGTAIIPAPCRKCCFDEIHALTITPWATHRHRPSAAFTRLARSDCTQLRTKCPKWQFTLPLIALGARHH